MSAARLRQAAALLRERAGAEFLPPAPWEQTGRAGDEPNDIVDSPASNGIVADCDTSDEAAAYITMMQPPVALAIAEWLTDVANWTEYGNTTVGDLRHAHTVADAILGATS